MYQKCDIKPPKRKEKLLLEDYSICPKRNTVLVSSYLIIIYGITLQVGSFFLS
jgi:hypothetical protein